jgi:hypothetical protein
LMEVRNMIRAEDPKNWLRTSRKLERLMSPVLPVSLPDLQGLFVASVGKQLNISRDWPVAA